MSSDLLAIGVVLIAPVLGVLTLLAVVSLVVLGLSEANAQG